MAAIERDNLGTIISNVAWDMWSDMLQAELNRSKLDQHTVDVFARFCNTSVENDDSPQLKKAEKLADKLKNRIYNEMVDEGLVDECDIYG